MGPGVWVPCEGASAKTQGSRVDPGSGPRLHDPPITASHSEPWVALVRQERDAPAWLGRVWGAAGSPQSPRRLPFASPVPTFQCGSSGRDTQETPLGSHVLSVM